MKIKMVRINNKTNETHERDLMGNDSNLAYRLARIIEDSPYRHIQQTKEEKMYFEIDNEIYKEFAESFFFNNFLEHVVKSNKIEIGVGGSFYQNDKEVLSFKREKCGYVVRNYYRKNTGQQAHDDVLVYKPGSCILLKKLPDIDYNKFISDVKKNQNRLDF
jgi:hypothetical protein